MLDRTSDAMTDESYLARCAASESARPVLQVDFREQPSRVFTLLDESQLFDLSVTRLETGDYALNNSITIERKTYADFKLSIIDARLFGQASRLARLPRPLLLIEGAPTDGPQIHPHAVRGALMTLATASRIPSVFCAGPEDTVLTLRLLAGQSHADELQLPRAGYRPRRLHNRRLFVLQGLPGVGPLLARRLLLHFGSVEAVMRASLDELQSVDGCGHKKAGAIRRVVADSQL